VNPVAIRCLILLLASISLAACGFKLAGTAEFPQNLSPMSLQTRGFSEQQRGALQLQLTRAGADLTDQQDSNPVLLTVSLKVLPDRKLVSSASSGKKVKRLTRSLDFSLKSADGAVIAAPKTLLQQKDLVLDDDNLLSSTREKANVVEDLEQALFSQLIRQLNRI
jgi:outer membrane lipopolysaccharide assembly protein LptE/RlpB